jgi:hypothetical protein
MLNIIETFKVTQIKHMRTNKSDSIARARQSAEQRKKQTNLVSRHLLYLCMFEFQDQNFMM